MTNAEGQTVALPGDLSPANTKTLLASLAEHRGHAIILDAQAVQRPSTIYLQIILGAATSWARDQQQFSIANASEPLREAVAQLGIGEDLIPMGNMAQ